MNTEAIEQAERTADRIREELFRTIDEIDRRREEAMDWRYQAKAAWPALAVAGGVIAVVVTARVLLGRRAREKRVEALNRERARTLRRAWSHPERVAPVRENLGVEFGTKLLMIAGTAIATQVARKAAKRIVG